jgi:head-tail adaptor
MKWPEVNPGEMVTQITILQSATDSDISGTISSGWQPFITTYAKVTFLRGTDVVRSGQDTAQVYGVIAMIYQPGITPKMRVQTRNGIYIIQSIVNPEELNVRLDLLFIGLGEHQ